MNNNEWYSTENWYAPLAENKPEAAKPTAPKPKKGWTPFRITGAVCILLALIVASSLIFGGGTQPTISSPAVTAPPALDPDDLPSDPAEFFRSFYQSVQTDTSATYIEKAKLPIAYEQQLTPASGEELTLQELYERCSPTIVAIAGYQKGVMGYVWGTGVILSEDGLILTNAHVIEDCHSATVTLFDDREFEAKLVGSDAISDLALLMIEADGLPTAAFGESATLQVGDRVAAIGNPLGSSFRNTLTDGIISAIARNVEAKGHRMTLLQTNTAINEGNSGGALFNMCGQVVGVTNMKMMSAYSSIEGIGFAIPSSTVQAVVNALVKDGEVRGRPSIGITVGSIPENAKTEYDLPEGLYISAVAPGTDAEAKGIRPGDVLMAVNGTPVTTTDEVNNIKNALQVGDTMRFSIWRDGEELEIDVLLMDTNDVYGK